MCSRQAASAKGFAGPQRDSLRLLHSAILRVNLAESVLSAMGVDASTRRTVVLLELRIGAYTATPSAPKTPVS